MTPEISLSTLAKLQRWFASECNADWEHTYGIVIETSDNPGWIVKIDLWETELADRGESEKRYKESEEDWFNIKINKSSFEASCSSQNLEKILDEFLFFSENFSLKS
jgi:hypothetical protein